MINDRDALKQILRHDFYSFIQRCFQTVVPGQQFMPNWHIQAIAHQLDRIRRGEIRLLIITVPPRNLKSICASVAFPAFLLGLDPRTRIVCVSYSQELASKLARDCRAVMMSPWYHDLFPWTRIDPSKSAETEFATTARGFRLATSVGGTLTGRGGNILILDDPMNPLEAASLTKRARTKEWSDGTLSTRPDDKSKDAIVVIMQRLHVDDLVAHLLAQGLPWYHLNLPAIAEVAEAIPLGDGLIHYRKPGDLLHPTRESLADLERLKLMMGSHGFSAQYQQSPIVPGGALIKGKWFSTYSEVPERRSSDRIVQSWDTASKVSPNNDYSVCTTWLARDTNYYLLHVLRERLEYPDLRRKIVSHAGAFGASNVLIEDAGSGIHLLQDLQRDGAVRVIGVRPDGDKTMRLEAKSALIEAGRVWLPQSAPWLSDFLDEILAFPYGRFDDQVDSFSQFLSWADAPPPTWNFDVL